jgi:ribosomal-protein-alanine N-acetyltransferase
MQTETARLSLRPFTADDLDDLVGLFGDPDVMLHIGKGVRSRAETKESLDRTMGYWSRLGLGMWAVHEKDTGRFVGRCGLQPLADSGDVELGYAYHRAFWGRGLATEGSVAALRFGFETLALPRIVAIARPENTASWRVMEKLGMTREQTGPSPYDRSVVVWYGLSRADYEKQPKSFPSGRRP